MAVLTDTSSFKSYLPLGLVTANTDVRVLSLHTRPALATLSVCCSMAS